MNTPGPWKIGKTKNCVVSDSLEGITMNGAVGENVVEYYGGNLIAESVSQNNVPLIAMAPELRLFLAEFIEAYEVETSYGEVYRIAVNLKQKLADLEEIK